MCGRYASFLPAEAIARLFHTVNPTPNVAPSWNVAPTQSAIVVRRHPETGERHLDLLQWGLLPSWTKEPAKAQRPINARAETVATSRLFKGAFKARRCIVPADAFYEWKAVEGGKQPFAIARQDGQPMAFAGLWEGCRWQDGCRVAENDRKSARSLQLLPLRRESRCAQFRILPQYPESLVGQPAADCALIRTFALLVEVTAAACGPSTERALRLTLHERSAPKSHINGNRDPDILELTRRSGIIGTRNALIRHDQRSGR